MTHTPTPWHFSETTWPDNIETINVAAEDGYHVCKVSSRYSTDGCSENEANAVFIVRACNSHDKLVEAISALLQHWDGDGTGKERRGEFEGVGYWSPAGRMVDTSYIVALRAALEGLE